MDELHAPAQLVEGDPQQGGASGPPADGLIGVKGNGLSKDWTHLDALQVTAHGAAGHHQVQLPLTLLQGVRLLALQQTSFCNVGSRC